MGGLRFLVPILVIAALAVGMIITVAHYRRQESFLSGLRAIEAHQIQRIEIRHNSWKKEVSDRSVIEGFAAAIRQTQPWQDRHNPLVDEDFFVTVFLVGGQEISLEVLVDRYTPNAVLVYYRGNVNGKWLNTPLLVWIRTETPKEL